MARKIALNTLAGWSQAHPTASSAGLFSLTFLGIPIGITLLALGIKKLASLPPAQQEPRSMPEPPGIPDENKGWITWHNIVILTLGTTTNYLLFKNTTGLARGIAMTATTGAGFLLLKKGEPILDKRTEIVALGLGFGAIGLIATIKTIRILSVSKTGDKLNASEGKIREAGATAYSALEDLREANELTSGLISKDGKIISPWVSPKTAKKLTDSLGVQRISQKEFRDSACGQLSLKPKE